MPGERCDFRRGPQRRCDCSFNVGLSGVCAKRLTMRTYSLAACSLCSV